MPVDMVVEEMPEMLLPEIPSRQTGSLARMTIDRTVSTTSTVADRVLVKRPDRTIVLMNNSYNPVTPITRILKLTNSNSLVIQPTQAITQAGYRNQA